MTALGIAVLATSYFTLPEQDPPKPDLRFDWPAIGLALASAVLPFIASGQLTGHSFGSYWFMVPLAIGLACLVTMLLVEYHQKEPLSPVKMMWHTLPLVGTLTAMIGGGAFITLLMLAERYEIDVLGRGALATGFSLWPQVIGVVVTAVLLGLLIRTRYLPVLALCGMLLLVGAGLILLQFGGGGSRALLLSAAGLLGLGAGATVSPGLWIAGMALPSKMVGRTFALVELVRSEADFLLGPVLLEVAQMWSGGGKKLTGAGFHHAVWVTLLVTAATTAFMVVLYLIGGVKLEVPNLEAWLKENKPAFGSPPLAATLRNAGGEKKAA